MKYITTDPMDSKDGKNAMNSTVTTFKTYKKWTNSLKDKIGQTHTSRNGHLHRYLCIKEMNQLTDNHPEQKAPGPEGLTGEVYQTLKKLQIDQCGIE